ncbi:MAG: hypothetical protein DRN15_09360 [Thermoprotei archaeon]|nr:MAG: hypothetical protein DRN15_09360 [Thermoprotei archaeon]
MLDRIWEFVKDRRNVIGYSRTLKPRIKDGKILEGTRVFRVYVTKKLPREELDPRDMIPAAFVFDNGETIETDVVEIGRVEALVDKTGRFRPVKLGVSVGHWDITAGSLGMLYEDRNGFIVAGSNAHVLTPDPSKRPGEIREKRILQPGAYHGGKKEENVVGTYRWHKRIVPVGESTCWFSRIIVTFLNKIYSLLGRKTRFHLGTVETPNLIDFAVYEPSVFHTPVVADGSLTDEPFIGHLFAGSSRVGVICKAKHIVKEGYVPIIKWTEVKEGDRVKGCSFWCNYETRVIDASAVVRVSYGKFTALFHDVIFVQNDGTIKGGWSGSGFRRIPD